MKKVLAVLFPVLFMASIAWGLIGGAIRSRDTQNYQDLQPELFAPDVIDTVLYDEESEQIYVCYNDANYVNVYTVSGEFLWAVATPYIRNSYFELQDDMLIIYGDGAYLYDLRDGSFLAYKNEEELSLPYNWETESADTFIEGDLYFDTYQVYQGQADGSLRTIVARPWWYWCFNFGVCWCIGFSGGIGYCVLCFVGRRKEYTAIKAHLKFKKPQAKTIFRYFQITAAVHLLYAVLDIICGFFGGFLCIGIIPLALHFIISSIILQNRIERLSVSKEERKALMYWHEVGLWTFLIAFFSVIVAVAIAG